MIGGKTPTISDNQRKFIAKYVMITTNKHSFVVDSSHCREQALARGRETEGLFNEFSTAERGTGFSQAAEGRRSAVVESHQNVCHSVAVSVGVGAAGSRDGRRRLR